MTSETQQVKYTDKLYVVKQDVSRMLCIYKICRDRYQGEVKEKFIQKIQNFIERVESTQDSTLDTDDTYNTDYELSNMYNLNKINDNCWLFTDMFTEPCWQCGQCDLDVVYPDLKNTNLSYLLVRRAAETPPKTVVYDPYPESLTLVKPIFKLS